MHRGLHYVSVSNPADFFEQVTIFKIYMGDCTHHVSICIWIVRLVIQYEKIWKKYPHIIYIYHKKVFRWWQVLPFKIMTKSTFYKKISYRFNDFLGGDFFFHFCFHLSNDSSWSHSYWLIQWDQSQSTCVLQYI